MRSCNRNGAILAILGSLPSVALAAEPSPAERGAKALLGRHFTPPTLSLTAYQNLWHVWNKDWKASPDDYDRLLRARYGFHVAPYPNDGYPMGLRLAPTLFGKALTNDCMLCHGGSIAGQSYVGLGNSALDFQTFFDDMARAAGKKAKSPFTFCNVRGTIEAGAAAVYLFGWRNPDLRVHRTWEDLGLCDQLCEDTPAWWLLKKKRTMYHTGEGHARSVRSLMQFMLSPLNPPSKFEREEATFRDIQAYILSLQPPKYPFPIDAKLAQRGSDIFVQNCAHCHGTYGEHWTYPNKIIPLAKIGTDAIRFQSNTEKLRGYYNRSWFAHEDAGWFGDGYRARATTGYQAPPLDGIWATAPYFHNGSAPTVYHVLNSQSRPKFFTRSYQTDAAAYDTVKLGWKVQLLDQGPAPSLPAIEQRKIYDTTHPGRGNQGHTFGDHLSEEERAAVIEYLKTI